MTLMVYLMLIGMQNVFYIGKLQHMRPNLIWSCYNKVDIILQMHQPQANFNFILFYYDDTFSVTKQRTIWKHEMF